MKLFYNDIALHTLGTVTLMEESSQLMPAESPQHEETTLVFRIDVWLRNYADNRETLKLVQNAIKTQHAKLKVVQERIPGTTSENDLTIIDQTARVTNHNFPSDINEWGTTRQQLRISFAIEKHDLATNAVQAIVTPTDEGASDFTLGNVLKHKEGYQTKYYDPMRDIREYSGGTMTMEGVFLGNMNMSLADRRAALITLKNQWVSALNNKNGRLRFADFDKIVRFDNFEADVDQHVEKIVWRFSCHYTKFPNESGYAGADFEIGTRKDSETGDVILIFSGEIISDTQDRAESKLAALTSAVLAANGFTAGRQTKNEVKARKVSQTSLDGSTDVGDTADTDVYENKQCFIKLSFSNEYRKREPDHLQWNLSVDSKEEANSGIITATYSGRVTAGYIGGTGASQAEQAYFNAVAKARELGENKHAFRLGGSIKRDDRQTTKTGSKEFVSVDFSFTYQFRGNRIFMEVKGDTEKNTFGEDSETVTGFIVGGDDAAVNAAFASVRDPYNSRIIRNERIGRTNHQLGKGSMPSGGGSNAPDTLWNFNASPGFETLAIRFDFSFQAFKQKPEGVYAFNYGIKIAKNFRNNTKSVIVSGTLFGNSTIIDDALFEATNNKLDSLLLALNFGKTVERERDVDRQFVPGVANVGNGISMALKFSESFESELTGDDQIIQTDINEDIQFSGDNVVVIPIVGRSPEIQTPSKKEARRTISGSVMASNETAALKYVKKQASIPFPTASNLTGISAAPASGDRFLEPPKITISNQFAPFLEGEVRGDDDKGPKVVKVDFSFTEIIKEYPYVL